MARVYLNGNLSLLTNGETEFVIFASNIKKVFKELSKLHPGLKPHLEGGVAVAVDGKVCQDAWLESVEPNSEVHIFHGIGGG